MIEKISNPKKQCTHLGLCDFKFKKLTVKDFADKLLPEGSVWDIYDGPYDFSGETFTIAHITDIHMDHEYHHNSEANCSDRVCCRKNSIK